MSNSLEQKSSILQWLIIGPVCENGLKNPREWLLKPSTLPRAKIYIQYYCQQKYYEYTIINTYKNSTRTNQICT